MKLNQPKVITWWIALVIAVVGLIAQLITIPFLSSIAFWLVLAAAVLLLLATVLEGL